MRNMKRLIAMVLVLCSLMSFVPAMAVAVGEGEGTETPVIVTYDFVLEQTELTLANGNSFAGAGLAGTAGSGAVAGYYASGELNWKYAANNHQTFKTNDSISIGQMIYFGGASNPWTGLRMGVKVTGGNEQYPAGHWTALVIKVETAGTYGLTFNYEIQGRVKKG